MPTKPRILHLIGSGTLGGREKQLYLTLRAQTMPPQDEVSVLFQQPEGPNYELIAGLPNLHVQHLPSASEASLRSMIACLRALRQADVVILHSPRIAFMLPLLLTRTPLIYRLSGLKMQMPRFFRRAQAKFGNAGIAQTAQTPGKRKGARPPFKAACERLLRWLLFRFIMQHRASVVLTNSRFLQIHARRAYQLAADKMRLVRNGLDLKLEQQRWETALARPKVRETFTVCFVGRLEARKRVDRLLRACAPNIKELASLRVLVAGEGELKNDLIKQARTLAIENAVQFLGAVANPYEVLKAADLFVLPSDNEAFSNAVLEAMFAEVPVVVFEYGCGNSEVITNGRNGFVVANESELALVIAKLAQDRALCVRAGRNGKRVLFEKGLTLEKQNEALRKIIGELCNSPARRSAAQSRRPMRTMALQASK